MLSANRSAAVGALRDEEDAARLARIAYGDGAAFDSLYRDYYERLFRFILRVTGKCDLVEDVLNDTMLVVWRSAGKYRAIARVSTWLFGIAYRKSLKALAREARTQPMRASDATLEQQQAPEALDRVAQRAAIRAALAHLPPEHRAVVELTFYCDRSYVDVARIMGCPVGTVKSRMFHARQKLRPLLAPSISSAKLA